MTETIAVLSDIHGNRWALEAVLEDAAEKATALVNLGDCLYGPLDPRGTAELILQHDILTVRGNQDRVLLEPDNGEPTGTLAFVRSQLQSHHIEWLKSLGPTAVMSRGCYLCHGSPAADDMYLIRSVTAEGAALRTPEEMVAVVAAIDQPVILCGHDHMPYTVTLPDGHLIVNPGSVGLPAYVDDEPYPHAMQTGGPHARYSLLSQTESGWKVENRLVAYDWVTAAEVARRNGREDWSQWLMTGCASE